MTKRMKRFFIQTALTAGAIMPLATPSSFAAPTLPKRSLALHARAEKPAPVLNTPDLRAVFGGKDGKTLARDAGGLIRAVEFIALPGAVFKIEGSFRTAEALVYRVRTAEYASPPEGLFVDSRFVSVSPLSFPPRKRSMPPREEILKRMENHLGAHYVWGGNVAEGVPELLRFYPPAGTVTAQTRDMWMLRGLDCSGLLYEATNGYTPRNTSELISFGQPVAIAGLTPARIAAKLQPLDLIVWKGHVIIVFDQNRTIESCMGCSAKGGVTMRKLDAVLKEILKTRSPVNAYPARTSGNEKPFVIRRWHPDR